MKNINYFYPIALSTALLSGCVSQAPITNSDSKSLQQAATHIISEAVYFSTLFSSCTALGGDTELDAINVEQNWLNANAKLVAAADSYYSQQQGMHTFTYNAKTLAPNAIRIALDARKRATQELALAQRSPANKHKTCQFRLAQISGDKLSLAKDPLIAPYQAELLSHLPLDINVARVPQLSDGIREVSKGATYFTIAKTHKSTCTAPYTLTIVNQWPHEAYANFCGANAVEVITCEWGKCETKKL